MAGLNDDILDKWSQLLVPVLENFYQLYKGNVNENFWQRICTHKVRGSGEDKIFSGWFLVFNPFNMKNEYILRDKSDIDVDHIYAKIEDGDITDSYVDVNINIAMNFNTNVDITLWGGVIGTQYNVEENILSVKSDFIAIKHPDITSEMFQCKYMKNVRANEKQAEVHDLIVKFGYYVITESKVPNNMIMKLSDVLICSVYLGSKNFVPTNDKIFDKIYNGLSNEYNGVSKYIKPDRKAEVISKFLYEQK